MGRTKHKYVKISGSKYKGLSYSKEIILKETKDHIDHIRNKLRSHGKEVTKELEKVIKTSVGTGRHYHNLPNRSSSPGKVPVSQSHELEQSFKYRSRPLELIIGNVAKSYDGDPYPTFLEDGTKKMERRPYFKVTIESLHERLYNELQHLD